jgi:hypothetical protein
MSHAMARAYLGIDFTCRLAVKDNSALAGPCWRLFLSLPALGVRHVEGRPQPAAAYMVAAMDTQRSWQDDRDPTTEPLSRVPGRA